MCTPGVAGSCMPINKGAEALYARDSGDGVIRLGNVVPDFSAQTTHGYWKSFHEWKKGKWAILFSHPADFTPVCTTEIASLAEKHQHLEELGFKIAALSVDSVDSHKNWLEDVAYLTGNSAQVNFPIIADDARDIAVAWGMIDPYSAVKSTELLTARCVYFINPENQLMMSHNYPACVGRNMAEIVRCAEALKLSYKKPIATPANWPKSNVCLKLEGEEFSKGFKGGVMLLPSVSEEDAAKFYSGHHKVQVPSQKSYLRLVKAKDVGYARKKKQQHERAPSESSLDGSRHSTAATAPKKKGFTSVVKQTASFLGL